VLAAHLSAVDPHAQYTLETAALATFAFAGYGGIRLATPTAASIGAGWTTVPFDTTVLTTPRHVTQDFAVNALRFDTEGVANISAALTITHNSSNSNWDRKFDIRLLNVDTGVPGMSFTVHTARRLTGTYFSATLLTDITVGEINDRFVLQIGNSPDTYSSVVVDSAVLSANYVSEFRGSL